MEDNGFFDCAPQKIKPTMEMKHRAVKYYNDHDVPKCIEDLLNKMFLEEPLDIYGYMAEYFASYSKDPIISKIEYEDIISTRGYRSFKGSVFCIINGLEKFVTCIPGFFDNGPKIEVPRVKSKPATGSKLKSEKKLAAAQSSLPITQSELLLPKPKPLEFSEVKANIERTSLKICGQTVMKQDESDKIIKSIHDRILEEHSKNEEGESNEEPMVQIGDSSKTLCPDCLRKTYINQAELYLSLLTAKLSSEIFKIPLYEDIFQSYDKKEIDSVILPTPMISMMKCGTDSPGKLNMIKCVYVLPKPGTSYIEGFQKISAVYRELGHSLQQKLGAHGKLTSIDGSYMPSLERVEQVFELLQQACNLANIELEEELNLIVDVGASYFYDEEKKKYEASTGSFKTAEDLITVYSDVAERYPVIGFIDGLSCKDAENCNELCKRLTGKCFCFGDSMFQDKIDNIEDRINDQMCNSAVVRLGSYFNNITELVQLSSFLKENGCGLIMSNITTQGCTSSLIPDLAVAVGSTFIASGPLVQQESIHTANRLIEIENELKQRNKLQWKDVYSFPTYKDEVQMEDEETNAEKNNEAIKVSSDKKKAS